jgi:cell division protein FtsB
MDWISIITSFVSVLLGGGILSFFTIKEQKKGLKIDNKTKEESIWAARVEDLNKQVEALNERIDKKDERIAELENQKSTLSSTLDSTRTKCAVAEILRCDTVACPSRMPPLGQRNLDVKSLINVDTEEN